MVIHETIFVRFTVCYTMYTVKHFNSKVYILRLLIINYLFSYKRL